MESIMKKKLLNILLASVLAATTLAGCNSGAENNSNSNSNSSIAPVAAQTDTQQSIGEEGGLLNIIGGNIEEAITEQVGSALWNLITKGQAFPQTAAEWDKQALISIQQNIQQIEAQLNIQDAKLNTIIQDIDNTALSGSDLKISSYLSNISDETTNVENLVQNTLPSNQSSTTIVNDLITGSAQPFSSQQVESLTSYVNNYNIATLVPEFTTSKIDTTEQQLSCDPSTTANTYYMLNNESQNAISHPTPNLSSNCLLSVALNNAYTDLTQNVQLSAGSNIFYSLQGFDQMLDTQYLQIVQLLTTAYYLDQLRLYLYVNLQPADQNHIATLLVVDPDSNNLTNLATAQAELQLAYNTRLSFVQTLFTEAKQQAFNHYAGAISSTSLENNCNFSYQAIESFTLSAQMSGTGNLYGWDGSQLQMTCQNQFNPVRSGMITTTTNLAQMCVTTVGSNGNNTYNLQSSNGYIRCGAGNTSNNSYGNYSGSNILDFDVNPATLGSSMQSITSYDGAQDELDYNIGSGTTDHGHGNLDISFIGQPLIGWDYYSWNNNGSEALFEDPSASFLDIFANSYTCLFCNSPSAKWGYVDDGQHAYMISAVVPDGSFAAPVIACIPNDSNCVQGFFPNNSGEGSYPNGPTGYGSYEALMFSNGDEITMTQQMGHGNYNIQTFYNGAAAPLAMGGHSPAINFSNVSYN